MDRIDRIVAAVKNTKIGSPVIEFGLMKDIRVELDDDLDVVGCYSESILSPPAIHLHPKYSDECLALTLVHELRHVEQSIVAISAYDSLTLPLTDLLKLVRIYEADASAYTSGFAHEVYSESGSKVYLDALEELDEGDIKDAFLKTANTRGNKVSDILSFRSAFDQWFKREDRVRFYDNHTCEKYEHADDSFFVKAITDSFNNKACLNVSTLHDIGRIYTGESYLDETNIKDDLLTSDFYIGNISPSVLRQIALGT